MEETRKPEKRTGKEEGEEKGSTQKTRSAHSRFKKWFLASAATTLLMIAGPKCTSTTEDVYYPVPGDTQEQTDAGPDTDVDADTDTDADTDHDAGPDQDSGPDLDADTDTDADTDMDGGPDLDADTDADTDSGTDLDGGPDLDADTDADTDSGTYVPCAGVYNDADYGVLLYPSPGHDTGGYLFYYDGYDEVTGDITVDIMCGSDVVREDVLVLAGTIQVLDITEDGKRVSITNLASDSYTANVNIVVEDIPSSGGSDGGVDGGVPDAGPDPDGGVITPSCTGVTNSALYGYALYPGYSVSVGGYTVTNNGAVSGGIEVDIDCGSDSSGVVSSLYLPAGPNEVVYDVPADGKRIRLHNHASDSFVCNISVIVEDL